MTFRTDPKILQRREWLQRDDGTWALEQPGLSKWLAEARRLYELGTKPQLRALSVICIQNHVLIEVRHVGGHFVWRGTEVSRTGHEWPDGTSRLGTRNRQVRHGFVDDDVVIELPIYRLDPRGSCGCGAVNISPGLAWVRKQLTRTDLPLSRRVVSPVGHKRL